MQMEKTSFRDSGELGLLVSNQTTAMLAYWDKNLLCRFANGAYLDWFGKSSDEMIDRIHLPELLGPLYEKNLPYIQGVLSGEKQLFEREIPIPGVAGVRHSLATYIPDFKNSEVVGFFVHVADITYVKNLEKLVVNSKQDILRTIIQTTESERRNLVELLRENINQKLVACKMMMEANKDLDIGIHKEVVVHISDIISDINKLCSDLVPMEIEYFGLLETIRMKLETTRNTCPHHIHFECNSNEIESIGLTDQLSFCRILFDLIKLIVRESEPGTFQIVVQYKKQLAKISVVSANELHFQKNSKEYSEILFRVEYFNGKIFEHHSQNQSSLEIEFLIPE